MNFPLKAVVTLYRQHGDCSGLSCRECLGTCPYMQIVDADERFAERFKAVTKLIQDNTERYMEYLL